MKYKVGDKVRVKSLEWYNENKNEYGSIDCDNMVYFQEYMSKFCGSILTIKGVDIDLNAYVVKENICYWTDDMFEGLAEEGIYDEEFKNAINAAYNACLDDYNEVPDKIKISQVFISDKNYQDKVELCLGDDYEIVVEDGRTFVQRKKPKYPKSFQECYYLLYGQQDLTFGCDIMKGAYSNLLECLQMLLICRDVYWKIAGEQMGLSKSWEPDWKDCTKPKYTIHLHCDGHIFWQDVSHTEYRWLSFPTAEMRDAFYENFKDLIEKCKELL